MISKGKKVDMKSVISKMEKIIRNDYSRCRLRKHQEWYMSTSDGSGYGEFMTLDETEDHLMEKMTFIKNTVNDLKSLYLAIEDLFNELKVTGNLYHDTLNTVESLDIIDTYVDFLRKSYMTIEDQERKARNKFYGFEDDLPF